METERKCACGNKALKRRSMCGTCKSREWREAHPEYTSNYTAERTRRVKLEVIALYGGACECCGESHPAFMTIDHVNNDGGGRNRKMTSAQQWYDAKKRHGDGYYSLACFNCNTGRHINGGTCPHRTRH